MTNMYAQPYQQQRYPQALNNGIVWAKTFAYLPEDAKEEWEKCGAKLAEKTAEVRLLLSK